ncbi:hypothetical protein C5Y86_27380, partial [Escherichia coli]
MWLELQSLKEKHLHLRFALNFPHTIPVTLNTVIIITVAFFILESAAGRAKDTFAVAVKVLSYMLPCTAIIMAVIWIIFFIGD